MSLETILYKTKTYKAGEKAVEEGTYVCVPCGQKMHFKKGMKFLSCISCLDSMDRRGQSNGVWEKLLDNII